MKIIRVTKNEFELEDGSIYPIEPELDHELTIEEFEAHYGRACELVQSIKNARSYKPDAS